MKKFYLINNEHAAGSWYLDGGVRFERPCWENSVGGFMFKSNEDIIAQEAEAEDWYDLDWKVTYLGNFKRDLREGWLSPMGEFVQADYRYHEDVAEMIIRKSSIELEDSGWIKMSTAFDNGYYSTKGRLTTHQKTWLNKNNFKI